MGQFSFDTIQNFDDHILKSIPNYDILFSSICQLSEYFIDNDKTIYDIGCSTGKLLKYVRRNFPKVKMVGVDYSENLLPSENDIEFIKFNLNNNFEFINPCIVYSIFTLQFIKKENRKRVIQNIYNALELGGVFIIAEKTYAETSFIQDIFTFAYYDYKKISFSEKEILDKEKDLRRILHPNTQEDNLKLLKDSGFKIIEKFYKYFMFEAYICIK